MKNPTFKAAFANLSESTKGASTLGVQMPDDEQKVIGWAYPFNTSEEEKDFTEPIGVVTDLGITWSFSVLFNSTIEGKPAWSHFTNGMSLTEAKESDEEINLIGVTFSSKREVARMNGDKPVCTPGSYEGRDAHKASPFNPENPRYDFSDMTMDKWVALRATPLLEKNYPMFYYKLAVTV